MHEMHLFRQPRPAPLASGISQATPASTTSPISSPSSPARPPAIWTTSPATRLHVVDDFITEMTVDTGGSDKADGEDDDDEGAERCEARDDEQEGSAGDGRFELGKQEDEETSVDSEEMDENIQMIYDNEEKSVTKEQNVINQMDIIV